jgi:23S rRNA (cytidine2498-2'-O)-methyltransferase
MTQYYFVLTNPEAEVILKEEIKLRYPELRLSYSRPGFITFKGVKDIKFNPLFCRVSGISLGKFKKQEIKFEKAWFYSVNNKWELPPEFKSLSDKSIFKKGESVNLVMMTGADEFWVGSYTLQSHHFQTPGEVSSILQKEVPSRAYYKMAETYEAFDLPFDHQETILELGSAPGGASLFLLEQDLKVLGVDPGEMDPIVAKNYDFKHIRRAFETLTENDFKTGVDWIISDINLPPTIVLREIFRLLTFLEPRGIIVNLKLNDLKHLEIVATIRDQMKRQGFEKVELKYLPSHRKEIALIALHS